jgi:serine 3-dehydrogenase (NADP+)
MASARRIDRLRELQTELSREGHAIEIHAADASSQQQLEELHAATSSLIGPVEILVYSTGTNTPYRSMKSMAAEYWDEMLSVNLSGAYHLSRAVLPAMRQAGAGHLIYISSISGIYADASGPAYQASKRGMLGLAHAIRLEEKENGIRTCVICPGLVATEILDKRLVKPGPEILQHALRPEDVAATVAFVAKLPHRVAIPELQIVPTSL